MNQKRFDQEIQRLLRRLDLLRAVRRGDVKLKAVVVGEHWVQRHRRAEHVRYVAPTGRRRPLAPSDPWYHDGSGRKPRQRKRRA